jgi:uncharacterized protein (TIGR01627 family)
VNDDDALRALVERNPGQATVAEYGLVDAAGRRRAPCHMLVFGVGRDAEHWLGVNRGGTTAFLENDRGWAARTRQARPGIVVHDVRYWTRRMHWLALRWLEPRRVERWLVMRGLPTDVTGTRWDVVFVDGPAGSTWHRPGRMQSIATAAHLATGAGADVFVHDCHRLVERECCDRFLGPERLVAEAGSMRHYRMD